MRFVYRRDALDCRRSRGRSQSRKNSAALHPSWPPRRSRCGPEASSSLEAMSDKSATREEILSMTPEQAAFLLHIQLPIIRKESDITSRVIKAVPIAKESYRPATHSRSALELVWHIASCDIW